MSRYDFQLPQREPLSPPKSMLSSDSLDVPLPLPDFYADGSFTEPANGPDVSMFDFLANSSWGSNPASSSMCIGGGMPSENMFHPDTGEPKNRVRVDLPLTWFTASSFNMPFTTMNNYNWLFDLGEMGKAPSNSQQNFNYTSNVMTMEQEPTRPDAYQNSSLANEYGYIADHAAANSQDISDNSSFQVEDARNDQNHSYSSISLQSDRQLDDNNQQAFPISPSSLRAGSIQNASRDYCESVLTPETSETPSRNQFSVLPRQAPTMTLALEEGVPPPQSQQTSMPKIDQVSRNEILKLLAIARPRTPEGIEIGAEHPDLSLSAMQNYLDLFFSRFNIAYPLLHQATFDPSETHTLLLLAVLLLGATYSKKAVHRLAVCIHDVLRGQIFQHSSFSAAPELWMLQTILLVECFGKSRAGQKQHDMAHLFHGLLIK